MTAAGRVGLSGGGGAAKVTSRASSAARSTASGLPHLGVENARVQVGDLAADTAEVGALRPGQQFTVPERSSVLTFARTTRACDDRVYVTFTVDGMAGQGSILRRLDDHVAVQHQMMEAATG